MAGAYEDVLDWVATRPWWQQQALVRIARGEELQEPDFEEIARQLVAGEVPESPEGGWLAGLAQSPETVDEPVRLLALRGVSNVNSLASGQELTFFPDGLTVVFGNNGSGKSGYARVIRSMVRTRYSANILPDVFAETSGLPAGELVFRVGKAEQSATLGGETPAALGRVSFYDEHCGESYLTGEAALSYRPSAIQLLDDLATVCAGVRAVVEQWRAAKATVGRLPEVDPQGPSAAFLQGLKPRTTDAQIDAATACPPDAEEILERQVEEVARLRTVDPERERQRLSRLSTSLRTVVQHFESLNRSLGLETEQKLAGLTGRVRVAEEAAAAASNLSFAGEPLPGVGTEAWRLLWNAAEDYSAVAFQDDHFPHVEEGAVCVLCQQPLGVDAATRLARFQRFVTDTTAREAETARNELASARTHVANVAGVTQAVLSAVATVEQSTEGFSDLVQPYLDAFDARRQALIDDTASLVVDVAAIVQKLTERADSAAQEAQAVNAAGFAERLTAEAAKERGMRDRIAMRDGRALIEAERTRLSEHAVLDARHSETNTGTITTKVGALTRQHVTEEARDQFTRESDRLELERITFKATKARQGVQLHKADFLNARTRATLKEVLSEGEQTALGFAGFLTEAHFDKSKSTLVFDDPVSSLDHMKREVVAKRIVTLAEERQVIVFTHDAAFTMNLWKYAEQTGVSFTTRGVERKRRVGPGFTTENHPWTAKDAAQRVNSLRQEFADLRRSEEGLTETEYTDKAERIAGHMSETWERIVRQLVADPLVDARALEVRVKMLRVIGRVTPEDVTEYDNSYTRISGWAPRHDRDPALNYTPPSVAELKAEIEILDAWFKRVKSYQNQ